MTEKSIGLIELSSVAAGFAVADTMLKAGSVRLILSRSICYGKFMVLIGGDKAAVDAALGGKAFCTLTGDVASVQTAVSAGRKIISDAGVLVNAVIISRPHPDVYRELV